MVKERTRSYQDLHAGTGKHSRSFLELLGVLLSQGQFQRTGGSTLDRITRLKKEEVSAAG